MRSHTKIHTYLTKCFLLKFHLWTPQKGQIFYSLWTTNDRPIAFFSSPWQAQQSQNWQQPARLSCRYTPTYQNRGLTLHSVFKVSQPGLTPLERDSSGELNYILGAQRYWLMLSPPVQQVCWEQHKSVSTTWLLRALRATLMNVLMAFSCTQVSTLLLVHT